LSKNTAESKSDENIPRSKCRNGDSDNVGKSTSNNIGKIIMYVKNNSNRKIRI